MTTWQTRRLGDVADLCLGKMLDEQKNRGEPLPYLANLNVRWGEFDLADLRQMRFESHEMDRYGLKFGDIVMCEGGEPGRCALWKEQMPGMMIQKALHRIRPHDGLDNRFLYYSFLHKGRVGGFGHLFTGATIKHLPGQNLAKIEIALPTLAIQQRIGEVLSAYDDLIENNRRRMALLENTARLLYQEWFVRLRFPGHEHTQTKKGLPEGWGMRRIGDVADCVGGGTPSTSNPAYWDDGDITWVTPTDVTRNEYLVLLEAEKKITEAGLANSSAKLVPPHTVLMTSRASVGFFAIAGREVCTNQGFISIVPQDPAFSSFLLFQLSHRVEEIRGMGSGSTYPEVSRGKFREFPVLIPQRKVVVDFDEQATLFLKQIRVLKQQNQKLRAARDLLLPRLMSGEIAV
jgi:type I restriction enzyme, S subunit